MRGAAAMVGRAGSGGAVRGRQPPVPLPSLGIACWQAVSESAACRAGGENRLLGAEQTARLIYAPLKP